MAVEKLRLDLEIMKFLRSYLGGEKSHRPPNFLAGSKKNIFYHDKINYYQRAGC